MRRPARDPVGADAAVHPDPLPKQFSGTKPQGLAATSSRLPMHSGDAQEEAIPLSGPTGFYGDAAELLSRELDLSQSAAGKVNPVPPQDPESSAAALEDKWSACLSRFDLARVSKTINELGSKKVGGFSLQTNCCWALRIYYYQHASSNVY